MDSNILTMSLVILPIVAVACALFFPTVGVICIGFALSMGGIGAMLYTPATYVLGATGFGVGLALIVLGGVAKLLAGKADRVATALADQPAALSEAILDAIDGRYADQPYDEQLAEPPRQRYEAPAAPTRPRHEPAFTEPRPRYPSYAEEEPRVRDEPPPFREPERLRPHTQGNPPREPEAYRPPLPDPPRRR